MTYSPPAELLDGLTYDKASRFGMPHINAWYATKSVNSHKFDRDAYCLKCGRPVTNAHHEPFRGMGGGTSTFTLHGVEMRPALIALCGSGATGCHGDRHKGLWVPEWVWDSDENAEMWWTGQLFKMGLKPHDPILYAFGCWKITNKQTGHSFCYREVV